MRSDPGDPFAPERIVVPHPTVGRWLSLELARALGIAANLRFEQPAEFAWSIMRGVAPDLSGEQPYNPARLRWRIHDLLSQWTGGSGERAAGGDPAGGPPDAFGAGGEDRAPEDAVGGYLRDGDPRKRLELARPPRPNVRPVPSLPPRLDPGVGGRVGPPLAGATVAAPGGSRWSGRRPPLGQRHREVPSRLPRWRPRRLVRRRLVRRFPGRRLLVRRSLGRRLLGRRLLGRRLLGRRSLGRRLLGRRSLGRRSLGRRLLGRCSLGRRPSGRRLPSPVSPRSAPPQPAAPRSTTPRPPHSPNRLGADRHRLGRRIRIPSPRFGPRARPGPPAGRGA